MNRISVSNITARIKVIMTGSDVGSLKSGFIGPSGDMADPLKALPKGLQWGSKAHAPRIKPPICFCLASN